MSAWACVCTYVYVSLYDCVFVWVHGRRTALKCVCVCVCVSEGDVCGGFVTFPYNYENTQANLTSLMPITIPTLLSFKALCTLFVFNLSLTHTHTHTNTQFTGVEGTLSLRVLFSPVHREVVLIVNVTDGTWRKLTNLTTESRKDRVLDRKSVV